MINLGDQYGLSLYDGGALESVGGSLVDSPAIQAAAPQQSAPALGLNGAEPGAPIGTPGEDIPPPNSDPRDNFETLKQAIRIVNSGDALTRVATRVQTAHVHRYITDEDRTKLLELGAARRKALNEAAPSR